MGLAAQTYTKKRSQHLTQTHEYGFFRFKSLLASFGPDGNPKKEIEISDVKYNIFQVIFIFLNQRKKNALMNPSRYNNQHSLDL